MPTTASPLGKRRYLSGHHLAPPIASASNNRRHSTSRLALSVAALLACTLLVSACGNGGEASGSADQDRNAQPSNQPGNTTNPDTTRGVEPEQPAADPEPAPATATETETEDNDRTTQQDDPAPADTSDSADASNLHATWDTLLQASVSGLRVN